MKSKKIASLVLIVAFCISNLTGCKFVVTEETAPETSPAETETVETTEATETSETEATPTETTEEEILECRYIGMTAEEICTELTIEEKANQMVQGALYALNYNSMEANDYGSVLSTNGNWPANSPTTWTNIINHYQTSALTSDTGIPFIYGNDSVHGVNTADGSVIFPHNINIGAANDPELTYQIGVLTGSDIMHTGMIWNFAPCVAAAQDPRWGRTYESYSSDLDRVTPLAVAYTEGLISQGVVACAKHYLGDGNALYGTGENSGGVDRLIDRGDAILSDEQISELLDVYQALVDSGVQTIMLSHSALNGVKMHENAEYIRILKEDMGFTGVVISDWNSLHNCSGETLKDNVILCINAGCDMLMEDADFAECAQYIVEGYNEGLISQERIDDAVTRILQMKIDAGLIDDPFLENVTPAYEWNSDEAHEAARTMAAESFVMLKNEFPIQLEAGMRVFVTGPAADDTGVMCGGWTYTWLGDTDANIGLRYCPYGPSILSALNQRADELGIEIVTEEGLIDTCDVILLCVGEDTYAEWEGDTADLSLTGTSALPGNAEAIALAEASDVPTITLIVAGRNVLISDYINNWASVMMCYLPGTEGGNAVVDVLAGIQEPTGTLPMPYYSSVEQIGTGNCWHDVGYSAY